MTTRAYDESYVLGAQIILGHAVDFSVISLGLDPDTFGKAFSVSDISRQFAKGNPRYVAGLNGCELARMVLTQVNVTFTDTEDIMYLDRSPEYWAGWGLAYYQWYSGLSFMEILTVVSLSEIIKMYPVYHEMDIIHFTERMDFLMRKPNTYTRLRIRRTNCHLSQSQLASDSGVALRQIQLFEQRQRNINNASAATLLQLSRSLHCGMEDLMEK